MPGIAFASLAWRAVAMPGSSAPVRLAQLPHLHDAAFRAFVQFPAGWARPGAGHYAVAEELLILEGDLAVSDTTWRGGGYAWIPANRVRSASRSESGCLAFAWFAAAPRWIPGEPAGSAIANDVTLAHWRDAAECALDGTGSGRRLYAGPEHHTWIVERRYIAGVATPGMRSETLGLYKREWRSDTAHEPGDDPAGAVLVRVW